MSSYGTSELESRRKFYGKFTLSMPGDAMHLVLSSHCYSRSADQEMLSGEELTLKCTKISIMVI